MIKITAKSIEDYCRNSDINIQLYDEDIKRCLIIEGEEIKNIVIPDGVDTINAYTFYKFSNIESVTIPNSVTSIGKDAFSACSSITSVHISDIVAWCNINFENYYATPMSFADSLYLNWKLVTNLVIPEGVDSINNYVFCSYGALTSITIPNSVTSIGDNVFKGCSELRSISIGNSVTSIGDTPFWSCDALTSIQWNAKKCIANPFSGIRDQIRTFIFGDNVEYIPAGLCNSMSKLKSISIPNNITYIGEGAFSECSSLSSVQWNAKKCNDFNSNDIPFEDSPISSFILGDNVKYIPAYLCYNMKELTSITIPNSLTSIGKSSFEDCTGLTQIEIPNSVTFIGFDAFAGCNKLCSVQIGKSIKTIDGYAFYGCTAINSISINAIIPPIIDVTTFSDVSRTAQIKVPCNAVATYQASNYWNEFTNYIESPYSLSVNVNDNSMGVAVITKQNTCADVTAQVQAQALPGYEFVKWSDGFTENPHTIYVTSDTIITAEFRVASTPVENITDNQTSVYSIDGILHIDGLTTDYQIYNVSGQLVYIGKETTLSLPRGIYLIVINGNTQKIAL